MRVCLLGSGSRGNSFYVESRGTALIIDQGFSFIEIQKRLNSQGLDEKKIKSILITHEHHDHINGVGVTARKLDVPVYATSGTFEGKRDIFNGGEKLMEIESGVPSKIGPFEILPFSVPHDAKDPVQYRIHAGKKKISIATDLGFVSTLVEQCIKDSDLVVIEANHDVEMLKKGSYPWELKQRIMSRTGHLSNVNAAQILFNIGGPKAVLAHLSEENNRADLAEKEVRSLFERFDHRLRSLQVAAQHEASAVIEI